MTKLLKAVTSVFFATLLLLSCNSDENDDIKIYITCLGSSTISSAFNGTYVVNGDATGTFDETASTSTITYYNTNLGDEVDSVTVYASKIDAGASLKIDIYRDTKVVKSSTLDAYTYQTGSSTQYKYSFDLSYVYGEEESSSTSTTTTTTAK